MPYNWPYIIQATANWGAQTSPAAGWIGQLGPVPPGPVGPIGGAMIGPAVPDGPFPVPGPVPMPFEKVGWFIENTIEKGPRVPYFRTRGRKRLRTLKSPKAHRRPRQSEMTISVFLDQDEGSSFKCLYDEIFQKRHYRSVVQTLFLEHSLSMLIRFYSPRLFPTVSVMFCLCKAYEFMVTSTKLWKGSLM